MKVVKSIKSAGVRDGDRVFRTFPAQDSFIFSEAKFPAFVGAWGTGKSFAGIQRSLILSEESPGNMGVIFRREFTDLRDSTLKDFEAYTNLRASTERAVTLPNKSVILFRHLEEIQGTMQNMNLGWFWIEQAEELDTDAQFFVLHGRLRRNVKRRTGFITANTNGHNWIYKLWKIAGDADYPLFEADSFQATAYLPEDTLKSWRELEKKKPKVYRRFVLNSWDESDAVDVIISPESIERAFRNEVNIRSPLRRLVSIDVARYGDDRIVFYALEGDDKFRKVLAVETHDKKSTMETVGLAQIFAKKHGDIESFAVDEIGVGAGVVDRLHELERHVIPVNAAERENVRHGCYNRRAEIYVTGSELFEAGRVQMLETDEDAREELSWTRYKTIKSSGVYQVEPKDDVKERYGRSPDHADALLNGLWALPMAKVVSKPDKYMRGMQRPQAGPAVGLLG